MTDNQYVMLTATDFKCAASTCKSGNDGKEKPWRIIRQGPNLKGMCENSGCKQHNVEVIDSSKGLVEVDFSKSTGVAHCPTCTQAFDITNVTFFRCHWDINFSIKLKSKEIKEGTNSGARLSDDDEFHTWTEGGGEKIVYTSFKITTSASKCFAGDTLVKLADGTWRQIQDLTPGTPIEKTYVKAVWHKSFRSPQKLLDIQSLLHGKTAAWDCSAVQIYSPVLVSREHPIFADGKWVKAKCLELPEEERQDLWNILLENPMPITVGQAGNPTSIHALTVGAFDWLSAEIDRWKQLDGWSRGIIHEVEAEEFEEESGMKITGYNEHSPCYASGGGCKEFLGSNVKPRNIMQIPPRCQQCDLWFVANEVHAHNLPSGWILRRGLRGRNKEITECSFGPHGHPEPNDGKPRLQPSQSLELPDGWSMTFCEISTPLN